MIKYKTTCLNCKTEVVNAHFDKHKCKLLRETICAHCGKTFKNLNSTAQHIIRCDKNPDKMDLSYLSDLKNLNGYLEKVKSGEVKHLNGYTKANLLGNSTEHLRELARRNLSELNKNRIWDNAAREKHSEKMKLAVEKYPDSYTSLNRGRTKQILYNGEKFQGSWELKFYKWCEENNITCIRNKKGFPYIWNGNRTYYPDFYLPDSNTYVEVKGYKTDRDNAKWEQFPEKLLIVEKKSINDIDKNKFSI